MKLLNKDGKVGVFAPFLDGEEDDTKERLKENGFAPIVTSNPENPGHKFVVGTVARGKGTWVCNCENDYIRSGHEDHCELCKSQKAN